MLRIAERRLKKYDSVQCFLRRIEELLLDRSSLDVVVIHNVLHDVQENDRPATVAVLVRALKPRGRLCLREPTKPSHGLAAADCRELMIKAGLSEVEAREYRAFPIGQVFDIAFVKGASGLQNEPK